MANQNSNAVKTNSKAPKTDSKASKIDSKAPKTDSNATRTKDNATNTNDNATKPNSNGTKSKSNPSKFNLNATKSNSNTTKRDPTATKINANPTIETRTSFMFPLLHPKVVEAVSDTMASPWFKKRQSTSDKEYSTHVMGKFRCNKNSCATRGWASKKVAILIRGYPNNGYNASVFNQRCRSCNQLGKLTLDEESYVDRVAYRLKKWAGVQMEKRDYESKQGKPHESHLCEGCKRGLCRKSVDWEYH